MNQSYTQTSKVEQVAKALRFHLDYLRARAYRLTRSKPAADDLVQDASLRALRFADQVEEPTSIRAWLDRVLFTTFISQCRRRKREREILESFAYETPRSYEGTEAQHLSDTVARALKDLPAVYRVVVEAVDLRDQTYVQTAGALQVPVGTVMSRLHRGRKLLRPLLGELRTA
ncbi:MAG: RNA polymerase sigma factor [Polyangiaceae bacterium]|nr:RNA polymerase sigma factor [Polyangiaceae bacterium]